MNIPVSIKSRHFYRDDSKSTILPTSPSNRPPPADTSTADLSDEGSCASRSREVSAEALAAPEQRHRGSLRGCLLLNIPLTSTSRNENKSAISGRFYS